MLLFFFSLKVWVAKMTITWTSIIKLNTSCRFHRESKRSFQIRYSVVLMGHVRSPDHQKFLGSMDTNFFLPTVLYCERRSSSTIPDSRFAHQMKPHLSYYYFTGYDFTILQDIHVLSLLWKEGNWS